MKKQQVIKTINVSTGVVTYQPTNRMRDVTTNEITTISGNFSAQVSRLNEGDFDIIEVTTGGAGSPSYFGRLEEEIDVDGVAEVTVTVEGNSIAVGAATATLLNDALNKLIHSMQLTGGIGFVFVSDTDKCLANVILKDELEITIGGVAIEYVA